MLNNSATGFAFARRMALAAIVAACGLSLGASALGQVAAKADPKATNPAGQGPGLPFFDARLDANGVPLAKVTAHVDLIRRGVVAGQRAADLAALQAKVTDTVVDNDPLMGTPRFVRSHAGFLTGANKGMAPIDVVKGFVAQYPALFEIDVAEITNARVERDLLTDHNGMQHLTYQQQIKGVDLWEAEIRANVTRDRELINIQSTMLPRPAGDFVTPAIRFEDSAAIVIASANVGVKLGELPTAKGEGQGASKKRTWETPRELRANDPLTSELVYFALDRDTIHPAWNVSIPVPGDGHTYDIIVDATDGAILRRNDRLVWDSTQPIMMRVYTSGSIAPGKPGTANPTGFQYPVVARDLVTVNPADMTPYSPNGWIPDGSVNLTGNNTDTYLDADATTNSADTPRTVGTLAGGVRTFDFAMDPSTQAPSAYKDACAAQMFYYTNWYHDRLYALGFNEPAKNFQTSNFANGGTGGDAVLAECQDSSGTNNANFSASGTDGTTGRCQMYIFTGPNPDRDGAFDSDIVFHELTHGTSIRLHNGLSGAGTQPGGMGEGWSDFVGMCLIAKASDDPNAVYDMGGYTTNLLNATFTTNYYYGIRRFPYSTDFAKAPQTYADIDSTQISFAGPAPAGAAITTPGTAGEVHNVGEIWCQILHEGRAAMWLRYPPTPAAQPLAPLQPKPSDMQVLPGNQRILQNVIDGMKLDPSQPTLLQARDAIIAANVAGNGAADRMLYWRAFAKRGLGFSATSPASSTTTPVVEAYDLPPMAAFTFPDGIPTQLLPGAPTTFRVNVTGTVYGAPIAGTGLAFASVNGGAFTAIAMTQTTTNQYTVTIPGQTCLSVVTFYVTVGAVDVDGVASQTTTSPAKAPTTNYRADVYTAQVVGASDGFETATGWTVVAPSGTSPTGAWERATPAATAAQVGGAHTGTFCYVTGAAAGTGVGGNDVDGGTTTLTSPAYNLTAQSDWTVSYWRSYTNNGGGNPNTQTFRVDVATDAAGTNWVNGETVGPTSPAVGWQFSSWTLSSKGITPTATVRVRFTAEDLIGAVVEAAVDDFAIKAISCTAPTPMGGCCVTATGNCTTQTQAACGLISGAVYLGNNVTCTGVNCPVPPVTGACCVTATGSCSPQTQVDCGLVSGAVYLGNSVACTALNCPVPPATGACCVTASGDCTLQTQAACANVSGGSYLGDNSICSVANCPPPPPTGACCDASTGDCVSLTQVACGNVSGNYQGNDTLCVPNPCPPPTGACCPPNGACTVLTSAACVGVGTYQGNTSVCVPNPCVPVTFVVSIIGTGSGTGTVVSSPTGINCGVDCSVSFVIGTNLSLTATPAANSKFMGWSGGGCAGAGGCSQPVNGPLTINARFRCKADINDDGVVNVADIFAYLSAWFAQNQSADFNGDNIVTVADIFAYLGEWFSGC